MTHLEREEEEGLQVKYDMMTQVAEWFVNEYFAKNVKEAMQAKGIYPLGNGEYVRVAILCDSLLMKRYLDENEDIDRVVDLMNLFLPERTYAERLDGVVFIKEIYSNLFDVGMSGNIDYLQGLFLEDLCLE